MFRDTSVYLEEFADYQDGSEGFEKYESQLLEVNARKAARETSNEYIKQINEYLYGRGN